MFEPKCDWWRKIRWEDKTVLLKGILSIKRKDYGRFVELALDAGMREALAGDYDVESQSGEFWFDAEKEGPRGILNWLGFSVEDAGDRAPDGHLLNPHGRYAHSAAYVRRCLEGAGFAVLGLDPAVLRTEGGKPVHGLIVVARAA